MRHGAPHLAVGDGTLGFWKALREVFPESRERAGFNRPRTSGTPCPSLRILRRRRRSPKSTTPRTRNTPKRRSGPSNGRTERKFPKAAAKLTDDEDVLLAFYDYPAEHWIHLRTTNPIETTFATVRLRTRVTRGAGSRTAALAMTFKLIESAQVRWRAVNAPHLVALVRAGARFERGVLVERAEGKVA